MGDNTSDVQIDQALNEVLNDADEALQGVQTITLTNGAIVKLSPPPSMMIQLVIQKFPTPVPPMVEVVEGERRWTESNPNDPGFKIEQDQHAFMLGRAMQRLLFYTSVEVLEHPEGVEPYDPEGEWAEELEELLEIEVSKKARLRKVTWLRYKILGLGQDFSRVQEILSEIGGASEKAVKALEDSFPGTAPPA